MGEKISLPDGAALSRRPAAGGQYLSVNLSHEFPRDELGQYLRAELVDGYRDQLPEYYLDKKVEDIPLNKLLSDVWRIRHPEGTLDPYAVLASMPLPLYVTAQPWNLLAESLRAAGKDPQVETCQWKRLEGDDPWWGDPSAIDSSEWAFLVEDDPTKGLAAAEAGWPTSVFARESSYRP